MQIHDFKIIAMISCTSMSYYLLQHRKLMSKTMGHHSSSCTMDHRKESNNMDHLPRLILVILAPFFDQICEDVIKIRRSLFTSVFIVDYTRKKQFQKPILPLSF